MSDSLAAPADGARPVATTTNPQYASPGAFNPIEPRRRRGPLWSTAFVIFGVLIPLVSVLAEVTGRWCSQVLFDPLPTVWHGLLAGLVPVANAWVYWETSNQVVRRRALLGFVNALAIGSAAYFSLTFLPTAPLGVIGIIAMGLGLLLLGPHFSLIAAVVCRGRLRRWNDLPPDPSRPDGTTPLRVPFLAAGLAVPLLVLGGMEASRWYTLHNLSRAVSGDPDRAAAGVSALRVWRDDAVMLDACLMRSRDGGAPMAAGWDWIAPSPPSDPADAAAAFYRVTGRPPQSTDADAVRRGGWRGRGDRRFSDRWDAWEEDRARGGEAVGAPVAGLSLARSTIDATLHPDAATFYAEWTVEFRNDTADPQEARFRLQLPDDGVVSRVTLWIDGEEREAAYGPRGKVREAYQSVAVVQRRDPVLVTGCGPGRVMVQCFPVPAKGTMKTKVGVSAPLSLSAADRGGLRLPRLLERNFALPPAAVHNVAVASGRPIGTAPASAAAALGLIAPVAPPSTSPATAPAPLEERMYYLTGTLTDADLAAGVTLSTARRADRATAVIPDPFDKAGRHVVQTVTPATRPAAAKVAIVVDGSAPMKATWADLCASAEKLSTPAAVFGVVAGDEVTESAGPTPAALAATLKAYEPIGGQDAVPALERAVDRVGDDGVILWFRGPQPMLLSPVRPLAKRLAELPNVRLIELPAAAGHNRVADALAEAGAIRPASDLVDAVSPAPATLADAVAAATTARPLWVLDRRLSDDVVVPTPTVRGNINLARLWASGEVDRLLRTGTDADRDAATKLAVGHQLVTAVSGAVVLETKAQYDAHDLSPVNAAPLPPGVWAALAMLPLLWLGRRWARRAAA